jgi:hypothetical protein
VPGFVNYKKEDAFDSQPEVIKSWSMVLTEYSGFFHH